MDYTLGRLCAVIKPKYKVISTILGEDFRPTNGLDIFLDLNSVVEATLSSQKYLSSMMFASDVEEDMVSSILYIVKHWKDFSRKYETDVRIFLMVNSFEDTEMYEHSQLKSYLVPIKHKYANERLNQLMYYWRDSLKKIKNVMNYIPGCYLIQSDKCDSYVIPNLLDDYTSRQRIVVSGSSLFTNYHYMNNTKIIYSRYRVTGMAQLSDPIMIVQALSKIDEPIVETFAKNKVFYNLLSAIIGDKNRGMIGLTQLGITGFAETLLRAVEKRDIPENPQSLDSVLPVINTDYHEYLKQVYPLIDIELHSNMIPSSYITELKSNLVDKYEIDKLRGITVKDLNLLELL
jgi:hypothetical protein